MVENKRSNVRYNKINITFPDLMATMANGRVSPVDI